MFGEAATNSFTSGFFKHGAHRIQPVFEKGSGQADIECDSFKIGKLVQDKIQ